MSFQTIDWDATSKLVTFLVALLALGLSAINTWRQRSRLRAAVSVRHLRTTSGAHDFEVTIANVGNAPFSIRQASHALARQPTGVDIEQIFYASARGDAELFLAPGNLASLRGCCLGAVREARKVSITLHNDRIFSATFVPDERYAQNWVAFMLASFRERLPEYEVSYSVWWAHGAKCKAYSFYDRSTKTAAGALRGINPIVGYLSVGVLEVREGEEQCDVAVDRLFRRIAERLPDIFEIDLENTEGAQPISARDRVAYVLRYTRVACESYASETGGAELFERYGFEPLRYVPPELR
jgi:hypothetical protein